MTQKLRERWRTLRSLMLEDRYFDDLGGAPNTHQHSPHYPSKQRGSSAGSEWYSLSFGNDACDVQIATKMTDEDTSRWLLFMTAEDFRKLALWYLCRWVWGEWFGLRRRLFYWYLHRDTADMMRRFNERLLRNGGSDR